MTPEEFSNKQNELLARIPPEFHSFISYYCWEKGHAYGYEEVLSYVKNLVDEIEKPLEAYTQRVIATTKALWK